VSQFDLFGDPVEEAAPPSASLNEVRVQHQAAIDDLPEKLRPQCTPVGPMPTERAELDEWTRTSQRSYLLWLIGAIARGIYRDSSEANAPYVLAKLNGLGGEW
jgi:hypothetical protein